MIILGKNPDDIGCQLERLTRKILEHKGYTDITINEISSGGHEIDVTANYILPLPGKSQCKRLIAECKAHKAPVSLPDWLKFLGKIYVEEARTSGEISGLFVALSGVNGNVSGNFHELNQHKSNISILSGDALLNEMSSIYNLFSRQKIIECFEKLSSRKYLNIEAVYYEEKIDWLFTFSNDEYTIITSKGHPIGKNELNTIRPLIEKSTSLSQIVDLSKEAEVIARKALLQKMVISLLAISDMAISLDDIALKITDFASNEIQESIDILKGKRWLDENNGRFCLAKFNIKSSKCYAILSDIVTFFFSSEVPVNTFIQFYTSTYILKRLNKFFIRHISIVNGRLPFTDELTKLTLYIAKLSPGAFLYSITPDQMIVTHRNKEPKIINSEIDEFDRRVFKRNLFQHLSRDFENKSLKEFFYVKNNICEIESIQKVLVKSKNKIELQEEFSMRRAICAAHESIGGGYIQVLILDNAPEPWEQHRENKKYN